jgi:two-component system, LytTR family, response regulator
MTADRELTVVIADDEPLGREGLRADLARIESPATRIVAFCADGAEAVDVLARERPDVLLLDIAMPVLDGFEVLERLEPEQVPAAVIFVTAFDEHAIRAFEVHALDYLLKPVPLERLAAALERARHRVADARALERQRSSDGAPRGPDRTADEAPYLTRILVRDRGRVTVVRADDIDWIEADAYYVHLHTAAGSRLLRERMSVLEARLDPTRFVRTHRSAIVRIDRVREIRSLSRYEHEVRLTTGARAPLSRERRARLEALLAARGS